MQIFLQNIYKTLSCILLMVILVYIYGNCFAFAMSNSGIEVTAPDTSHIGQGETTYLSYQVLNKSSLPIIISEAKLDYEPWFGINVAGNNSKNITLGPSESAEFFFTVKADVNSPEGTKYANFSIFNNENLIYEIQVGKLLVQKKESIGNENKTVNLEASIEQSISPKEGWEKGKDNEINFEIINKSEFALENLKVELNLPEGYAVKTGTNIKNIGNFDKGRRKNINFPVIVLQESTSSFLNVELTLNGENDIGSTFTVKKMFYIPNKNIKSKSLINDVFILNVQVPNEVKGNENFELSFDVSNRGKENLENIKIFTEFPEGIINKTKGVFIDTFRAGQTRKYKITLYAVDLERKSYGVKVGAESTTDKEVGNNTITQYANIFVSGGGSGTVTKTPQLMVYNYSYGGTYVQAGAELRLSMNFLNNSKETIRNIKVSISEPNGMFVPSKSSNSFFLGNLGGKKSTEYSIYLRANADAKQGIAALTVEMFYENGKGESLTAKDVISIPVVQEQRLVIDDLMIPNDLLEGNPASISVVFYNMGKSVLNNLRVTALGDFDLVELNNYFVGNMEPGKSDTYDFSLIPLRSGKLNGAVKFTYEDINGLEQQFEKPFTLYVGEEPALKESEGQTDEKENLNSIKYYVIGITLICIISVVILIMRKKRINKQKDLLDEL